MATDLLQFEKEVFSMEEFVYFGHNRYDVYTALAVEEILNKRNKLNGNSYFWTFQVTTPAAVVAKHEDIADIYTQTCIESGKHFSRREGNGSVIWMNEDILGYHIITKKKIHELDEREIHRKFGQKIALSLKNYGLKEIYVGDKFSISLLKDPSGVISGNSASLQGTSLIYNGVLVLKKLDAESIQKYLRLRKTDSVDEFALIKRLPNFYDALQKVVPPEELSLQILQSISNGKYRIADNDERGEVLNQAKILAEKKYRSNDWIFNQPHIRQKNLGFCLIALSEEWQEKYFYEV